MAGMIAMQNHMNFASMKRLKTLLRYACVLFSSDNSFTDYIVAAVSISSDVLPSLESYFSGFSNISESIVYSSSS